ncbi:MAG: right-handed parallel beta-helix repeat-containing protein [Candidatus Bathyarchaeota archaeon]|nr:right-handed parallel beta-helix repeat-containing protein [Candidatus Bathyarchaeota archaeon]
MTTSKIIVTLTQSAKRAFTKEAFTLIIIGVLLASTMLSLQTVKAETTETLVVPDDYSTIQGAINAADLGDTIFVHQGTYREAVIVNKTVALVGENKANTVIDGLPADTTVLVTANHVNITGFKIINAASDCVFLNHSIGSNIIGNIIDNIFYQDADGITLQNADENTVSNNLITKAFLGIGLTSSNNNVFLNNVIRDNVDNIWLSSSYDNYFDNNTCRQSSGFSSIYMHSCSNNLFRRNEISQSVNLGLSLQFKSEGNVFVENTFSQNKIDFVCHYCKCNTFIHNNVYVTSIDNQDCLNNWDDGVEGNYWSNYIGAGDTPYRINSSYTLDTKPSRHTYGFDYDYHPLLSPYTIIPPIDPQTNIIAPQNITYNTNNVTLTLTTNAASSGTTYKLDGKLDVFYKNTTIPWLSNGTHTLTTYAVEADGTLRQTDGVVFSVYAIVNQTKPAEKVYNYDWSPSIRPNSPIVKIQSPIKNQTYSTRNIELNFNITEDEQYASIDTKITKVEYVLDPVIHPVLMVYTGYIEVPIISGTELTKTYSLTLTNVADGNHTMYVRAVATETYFQGLEIIVSGAAGVNFVVNAGSSSGSNQGASASNQNSPQPTPKPTPTPTPTSSNGSSIELALNGNITNSQVSNVTIATNSSASSTALSFTVTGQSGTIGFSNITIPKDNVPYGETPTVYIDNEPCPNQGYTQDENNYYVWYTIHFSTHKVTINFSDSDSPQPTAQPNEAIWQPNWLQITAGVAAALIIITIVIVVFKVILRDKAAKKQG